jgi:molybdopterin synthase catalytic subunit
MVIITQEPIDPTRSFDLVDAAEAGSVLFHFAVVKADGGGDLPTERIDYRQQGDAAAELEEIAAGLRQQWNVREVLLVRRVGTLAVGEIISLVAISSPASEDAFGACREGIARLKKMQTIVKAEFFDGPGSVSAL